MRANAGAGAEAPSGTGAAAARGAEGGSRCAEHQAPGPGAATRGASRAGRVLRANGSQDDAAPCAIRPSASTGLLGSPPRRGSHWLALVHAARRGRDDEVVPRARAEPANAWGDRVEIAGNAPFGKGTAVALAGEREVGMPQPYELIHRDRTTSCENAGHWGGRNGVSLMNYPTGIEQQAADPSSKELARLSLMNYSMGIEQQAVKPADSRKVLSQIPPARQIVHGNSVTARERRESNGGRTSKDDTAITTNTGQG